MEIIPSVLAKNEEELAEIKKKLEWYSGPLHIDVADGQFVPTLTVGREEIEKAFPSQMLDVHLMVQNPAAVIPLWIDLPNLRTIIFHIEASDKAPEIIDNIIRGNAKLAGIAINPETDVAALDYVINMVDLIHVMTVRPGDYGGKFLQSVVPKIAEVRKKRPTLRITVDGGITPENEDGLTVAGADALVIGSDIVNNRYPNIEYKKLENEGI